MGLVFNLKSIMVSLTSCAYNRDSLKRGSVISNFLFYRDSAQRIDTVIARRMI